VVEVAQHQPSPPGRCMVVCIQSGIELCLTVLDVNWSYFVTGMLANPSRHCRIHKTFDSDCDECH